MPAKRAPLTALLYSKETYYYTQKGPTTSANGDRQGDGDSSRYPRGVRQRKLDGFDGFNGSSAVPENADAANSQRRGLAAVTNSDSSGKPLSLSLSLIRLVSLSLSLSLKPEP